MTEKTPLGWDVLDPGSDYLHTWVIPGANRRITLKRGRPGYLLVVLATWFDRNVERLDGPGKDPVDEGGHNKRENRNSPGQYSEHSSGAAEDLNWGKHPNGVPAHKTFTAAQIKKIRKKIAHWNRVALGPVVRWGGDYKRTPDAMHFELYHNVKAIRRLTSLVKRTRIGKEVLKANPSQVKYL